MAQAKYNFIEIDSAVVRFAGYSGDGMQTVGERFTDSSAFAGNDIATLPDFPAEIRAPAGTLAGVSGFQVQFGSREILTPGDEPDALVAMNPAALKSNLADLPTGGMLVVNTEAFKKMPSAPIVCLAPLAGFAGAWKRIRVSDSIPAGEHPARTLNHHAKLLASSHPIFCFYCCPIRKTFALHEFYHDHRSTHWRTSKGKIAPI